MERQHLSQTKSAIAPPQTQTHASDRNYTHPVEELQGAIGNQAVNKLLANQPIVQAKPMFRGLSHELRSPTPLQAQPAKEADSASVSEVQPENQTGLPDRPGRIGKLGIGAEKNQQEQETERKPSEVQPENKFGLPASLKAGVEHLSGFSMDRVNVHYNSSKPSQIHALAYTQGTDIHVSPGQERHLPHEAWHVVQQMQGRVTPTLQAKGLPINDNQGLEAEADRMGARAAQLKSEPLQTRTIKPAPAIAPTSTQPIQCVGEYAALSPMAKARVDQQSEEKYTEIAQEFEFKMSPIIMANTEVNAIVDVLVAQVKKIVDAWAVATGRTIDNTYEREFGWAGGDAYYGAFEMTAANISPVFTDKKQPMRTKLKLVYNAVRNNNLSKWLKVAALQITSNAPQALKIKTATQNVVQEWDPVTRQPKSLLRGKAEKEQVKADFAEKSGLKDVLTKEQAKSIAKTAKKEKKTEHWQSKRDVFGHDLFSDVMAWTPETKKADAERRGGASNRLYLSEQRTLTVSDVLDLTDAEIDLHSKQLGLGKPDAIARTAFRNDPNKKILWGQGGESYDIKLGSDSAKAAAEVKARLEAGISGSTDLMLHAMQNLGFGSNNYYMRGMRLALAGWMLANRDHSFYEVYKAAESYGLAFDIDKNDPGKEYESEDNLLPMKPADFANLLLPPLFPKYYLSSDFKDILAQTLPQANLDQTVFKQTLKFQGISDAILTKLDDRGTAELSRLSEVVAAQVVNVCDRMAKKNQAIRRIKQHSSFIYLGNTLGANTAQAMLEALLKIQHGGKGLMSKDEDMSKDKDVVNILADAGIPYELLNTLNRVNIIALEAARQAVMKAQINSVTRLLDTTQIDIALNKVNIGASERALTRMILLQTYHGDQGFSADQQNQIAAMRGAVQTSNRIAIIEPLLAEIAQLNLTTGYWYSWGNKLSLVGYRDASSLRIATRSVPSTQGPGLYVANNMVSGSGYGDQLRQRMLVAKTVNTPTIHRSNKPQMAKIAALPDIDSTAGDVFERKGVYKPAVAEILLIFGAAYARLTTNQGVELTLDLKKVPRVDLDNAYKKLTGVPKANFKAQAQESDINDLA